MLDYQRIVDDVRSSLDSHADDGVDFLRAAAADYSIACEEVNERLHQCGSLLRQGLRSEAIQLSDIEPNLLDVVALLDFPERGQWIETSERCGIAPPTPLLLEVAAELNEAYGLEQPLAALLQRHRLLAMAHAPLAARIDVLRRLAEMDANSPVWQEDLRTFEQERQKQLQGEVEAAERAGDADRLASLDGELSSPNWKNPPPPPLARSASVAHTRLRYWAVQGELDELATDLAAAKSGFRLEQGRTLRDRWNEIITGSGWQPEEPIANRAAPALDWIDGQDRLEQQRQDFETATASLARAVEHRHSPAFLKERYRAAAELGTLPAELEQRYQTRLGAAERAARIRWWLGCTGLAAGVVLIVMMIGMIVSRQMHESRVTAATADLSALIDAGQFDKAEALVRNLSAQMKQDPRVQAVITLLQKKHKRETGRETQFSERLAAAKHSMDELVKQLDAEPGQTVLGRLGMELDHAQEQLENARKLAATEDDRAAVAAAKEFASEVNDKWQHQLDRAFLKQYEDFDRQLTKVARDNHSDAKTLGAEVDNCGQRLQEWENASSRVSPALLQRIATLKERLAELTTTVKQQEQTERDDQQITAAVGAIPNYIEALQESIRHDPSGERARSFKRVIDESLCWHAVSEWSNLAQQLNQTAVTGLQPATAEQQLPLTDAVLKNFAECAECEGLRGLTPYLKAIARRDNNGERLDAPIKKLFTDPLVADVWMVETDDGQRYYVGSQPEVGKPFIFIVGFDGKTRGTNLPPSKWDKAKVARAPQTIVAEQVKPILKNLDDGNWERSFCRIVAILSANRAMDPILRANLLQQVLEAGVRGSYCLEKAFGRHVAWFNSEARINAFANWLDPADKAAAEARAKAEKALESFPEIEGPRKTAAKDFATLRRSRVTEYRWVGWLHQTRDGHWECLMNRAPDVAGPLLVVYRRSASERLALAAVGRLDRQEATIDMASPSLLVAGRPVYLAVP
jgi:hypothetical protein